MVGDWNGRQGRARAAAARSEGTLLARMDALERFLYDACTCGRTFHMDLLSEMERDVFGRIPPGRISVNARVTRLEEELGLGGVAVGRSEDVAEERGLGGEGG